ncbi:MAG: ABC transporter permease [bacterium]
MLRMEKEILTNRGLLRSLVKRDLRGRYVGSMMGLFWTVIHPLIMIAIYVFVFTTIWKGPRLYGGKHVNYAIYLCSGMLPWMCVLDAVLASCTIILGNAPLMKKVVFPSAILPVQVICSAFINLSITMGLLLIFLAFMGAWPGWWTLGLIPVFALQFFLLLGPCFLFATLMIYFRDLQQLMNALMQILFWATPIFYYREDFAQKFAFFDAWLRLNPINHLMAIYRSVLINQSFPSLRGVIYLLAFGALSYAVGKYIFTRSRHNFVDEI